MCFFNAFRFLFQSVARRQLLLIACQNQTVCARPDKKRGHSKWGGSFPHFFRGAYTLFRHNLLPQFKMAKIDSRGPRLARSYARTKRGLVQDQPRLPKGWSNINSIIQLNRELQTSRQNIYHFRSKWSKPVKICTYFRPNWLKNHTLKVREYTVLLVFLARSRYFFYT